MADETVSKSAVHIVYTEQPPQNEQPKTFHIRTLTTVLGSEEAAREALVYSYKNAASGFSAKLTPEQVSEISNRMVSNLLIGCPNIESFSLELCDGMENVKIRGLKIKKLLLKCFHCAEFSNVRQDCLFEFIDFEHRWI